MLHACANGSWGFLMMCTVHNIKKIADFMRRKGKSLKEILIMITGGGNSRQE